MKKFRFSMLAMAGLLFAACADKDIVEGGQQGETLSEGYMSFSINLPTTPTTRAANDVFDDGVEDEYEVQDCAILLFQGPDEVNAKLIDAQTIILPNENPTVDNQNITTTYQAVAQVVGYAGKTIEGKTNNLYALVCLNYTNVMSIDTNGIPTIAGTKLTKGTSTLANICNLETNADLTSNNPSKKNYFFMTNAVLTSDKGGAGAVTTPAPLKANVYQLAKMEPDNIKQTPEEAKKEPAGEIFVERAVAKATLKVSANEITIPGEDKAVKIKPEATLWTIDNTQPTSYVARNYGDLSYIGYSSKAFEKLEKTNYRFVGHISTKLDDITDIEAYRTYWCVDPLYDKNVDDDGVAENYMKAASEFYLTGEKNPLYCYENTFDVLRQSYKNTTRAIVKIVLDEENAKFWTVTGGNGRFFDLEDTKTYVLQDLIGSTNVQTTFSNYWNGGETKYSITIADFDVTYEDNRDENGQLLVKGITLSSDFKTNRMSGFKDGFETAFTTMLSDNNIVISLNNRVVVKQYEDGVMYYEARFKHFAGSGDGNYIDLAPWNTWETDPTPKGGSTEVAYPDEKTREQNYLGRYGMVRNNWYDVDVFEIKNLGYPVDPSGQVNNPKFDDPDTPDDNINEYIAVKVHVLSWAKRMQSWGF